MTYSKDLIHTQGKIKTNSEKLIKAFSVFGFDINDFNDSFLKAFLRGQDSILDDAKNLKGKTTATINTNAGTIELGNDQKRCNKKIRTNIKEFIQNLKNFDMVTMQNELEAYLEKHFNYKNISFSFKAQNDQIIVKAKTCSDLLKQQQLIKHKKATLLFLHQSAIVNYVYDLQNLDIEIADFRESESESLKALRTHNRLKVKSVIEEHEKKP